MALPVEIYRHRGFTGTATLDPNPGTDVWPVWEWIVDVPLDNQSLKLLIGVLGYNSVSTTSAKVAAYTSYGTSTISLEYLGPIPTPV